MSISYYNNTFGGDKYAANTGRTGKAWNFDDPTAVANWTDWLNNASDKEIAYWNEKTGNNLTREEALGRLKSPTPIYQGNGNNVITDTDRVQANGPYASNRAMEGVVNNVTGALNSPGGNNWRNLLSGLVNPAQPTQNNALSNVTNSVQESLSSPGNNNWKTALEALTPKITPYTNTGMANLMKAFRGFGR